MMMMSKIGGIVERNGGKRSMMISSSSSSSSSSSAVAAAVVRMLPSRTRLLAPVLLSPPLFSLSSSSSSSPSPLLRQRFLRIPFFSFSRTFSSSTTRAAGAGGGSRCRRLMMMRRRRVFSSSPSSSLFSAPSPSPSSSFTCSYSSSQAVAFSSSSTASSTAPDPSISSILSDTEQMMQETVSRFSQDVILPRVRSMDEAEKIDHEVVSGLFNHGLMGIEIPETYGGSGMSFTAAIVAIEQLAKTDPSVSVLCDVQNTLVNTTILKYGSSELIEKWMPLLASKSVGSFALSEAGSGSDAFALQTKAVKTGSSSSSGGSYYTLNGSKMWITNSMESDVFIVFANLNPEAGHRGITAFIVEKSTPGFTISKKEKKMGIRASSTCELNLDNVQVPSSNLLGEEGQGYKIAISTLNEGRIGIAAQMTGLAMGAFETAARYIYNDRRQFGQLVGTFQGMQHQVAQAYTELTAARALVYDAARKKDANLDFVTDAAMAKLYASQVAARVSSQAVDWFGGMGFVREGLAEKFYRDSKIGSIYEGTSNIQLQTIAKAIQKQYTM